MFHLPPCSPAVAVKCADIDVILNTGNAWICAHCMWVYAKITRNWDGAAEQRMTCWSDKISQLFLCAVKEVTLYSCNTVCLFRGRFWKLHTKTLSIQPKLKARERQKERDRKIYNAFQQFNLLSKVFSISVTVFVQYSLIIKANKNVLTTIINRNLHLRINCQGIT